MRHVGHAEGGRGGPQAGEGRPPANIGIERWARHQKAMAAFVTVSRLLSGSGIRFAPVKGIVLARWLYDDVTERPLRDVDLLVARSSFELATGRLHEAGYAAEYTSEELGEAMFDVDGFTVELHAEIGRRELTSLSVDEVLRGATQDTTTFPFVSLRIDDIDHLLLLAANVVKDYFVEANPHQAEDLERLAVRLEGRLDELVERAGHAGFSSGLWAVADWMQYRRGSERFARVRDEMGRPPRRLQARALALAGRSKRLPLAVGLPLACWTNDEPAMRMAALARLARRGVVRKLGGDPDARQTGSPRSS